MSHFIAAAGEQIQTEITARVNLQQRFFPFEFVTRRNGSVALLDAPMPKVIPDLHFENAASGSWISIIGMPLLEKAGERPTNELLEQFFSNPGNFLENSIDGHFALVAYDAAHKRLYAATDFNSFIPVFYARMSDGIVVSSSELFIAALLRSDIDPMGISQSISLGTTWNDRTRFSAVKKMRPCELLVFSDSGQPTTSSYWTPTDEQPWSDNFDGVLDRWMHTLSEGVERFIRASGQSELSADLTGGEDSRLVVAQCHALGLPLRTRVTGFPGESDFEAAQRIAAEANIPLEVHPLQKPKAQDVTDNALKISLLTEGYGSFFSVAERYLNFQVRPPIEHTKLHFCGVPGGEAYRGTYYLRAKLLSPQWQQRVDTRMFGRMKFMLDYIPGLLRIADETFREEVVSSLNTETDSVSAFPAGTKVDHLLRAFQTALWSLSYRQPFYLPLGLRDLTKSIYSVPPKFKSQSKITRAATERLFPKLALIPTTNGVPTIRKTLRRTPLFLPGYYAIARKITLGAIRRAAHLKQDSKTLTKHHRIDRHQITIRAILSDSNCSDWFRNSESMVTGRFYHPGMLDKLLESGRTAECRYVQVLGQIINAELAVRQVNSD